MLLTASLGLKADVLLKEFAAWEAASDEDWLELEALALPILPRGESQRCERQHQYQTGWGLNQRIRGCQPGFACYPCLSPESHALLAVGVDQRQD